MEKNNELSEDFLHSVGAQTSDLHSGIVCHKAVLLWLSPALHLSCQISLWLTLTLRKLVEFKIHQRICEGEKPIKCRDRADNYPTDRNESERGKSWKRHPRAESCKPYIRTREDGQTDEFRFMDI